MLLNATHHHTAPLLPPTTPAHTPVTIPLLLCICLTQYKYGEDYYKGATGATGTHEKDYDEDYYGKKSHKHHGHHDDEEKYGDDYYGKKGHKHHYEEVGGHVRVSSLTFTTLLLWCSGWAGASWRVCCARTALAASYPGKCTSNDALKWPSFSVSIATFMLAQTDSLVFGIPTHFSRKLPLTWSCIACLCTCAFCLVCLLQKYEEKKYDDKKY